MKSKSGSTTPIEKTPFERFQELAKGLFTVPKEELEKKPNGKTMGKHRPHRKKPKAKPS